MKQGIVKFSKEFVTPIGLKEWVGVELTYDMINENPIDVLDSAKKTVNEWYKFSNTENNESFNLSSAVVAPVINVQRTSEDTRIAELVRDIYACTQLDGDNGLWSYSKLATTCKEAELAYEVMAKKLRKKESDELLAKCAYINQKQQ